MKRIKIGLLAIAAIALASFALAQEGHPLVGAWGGEWSPAAGQEEHVRVFIRYEDAKIVGTINPGRNGVDLTAATLNPDDWTVHFEADTKDGQHIVIEGKLDDIGSYNRTITGTWTQGGKKGDFKLVRD